MFEAVSDTVRIAITAWSCHRRSGSLSPAWKWNCSKQRVFEAAKDGS